jgi:hypothetical protein
MRIRLGCGRFLEGRDTAKRSLSAVIDEAAAKRYCPNRDSVGPIGHFGSPNGYPFQVLD